MSDNPRAKITIPTVVSVASRYISEAPLDRIKLLLQLQRGIPQLYPNNLYKGIFNCLIRLYREQGFLSYWRGITPRVIEDISKRLWLFSVNGFLRTKFPQWDDSLGKNIFTGGISGTSNLIVTYPFDCIRTKLAVDIGRTLSEREYTSTYDCAIKIWKVDGIRGFYRGAWLAFPEIFIYRGIYFGLYHSYKHTVHPKDIIAVFYFAQIITTLSSLASYPFDTIRRRMMIQSGKAEKFKNSFDCAIKILRKEGIKSFYGGFWLNWLRALSESLLLVVYHIIAFEG